MTSVPTIVGTFGTPLAAETSVATTRNTSVLPTVLLGDIIYVWTVGGANTWKHVLTAPGVTFVIEEYNSSVVGHLSAVARGIVTNAASASGAVVTCVLTDPSDVVQSSKMEAMGTVWRGSDNRSSGANAAHRRTLFVSGTGSVSVTCPVVTASTVANCAVMVGGAFSRGSTTPGVTVATVDGGAADKESWSQGTTSLHGGAIKNSITAGVSAGVTLGANVITADQSGGPRGAFTLLIAPFPDLTIVYDFDALRTAGYTGSLVEMRRQNLLALLSLTEPQSLSNADLEMQYLRSIGKTGSIMDMRKQLP